MRLLEICADGEIVGGPRRGAPCPFVHDAVDDDRSGGKRGDVPIRTRSAAGGRREHEE